MIFREDNSISIVYLVILVIQILSIQIMIMVTMNSTQSIYSLLYKN